MTIELEIISRDQMTDSIREAFADALKRQGKVQGNLLKKADRCKWLCIARIDGEVTGVGAIKIKTDSDFSSQKANLHNMTNDFDWELGYLFTDPDYSGKGIGKRVAGKLVEVFGAGNLMASTEISANPVMVRILTSLGFQQQGKPWKSAIHDNDLGLFLRRV